MLFNIERRRPVQSHIFTLVVRNLLEDRTVEQIQEPEWAAEREVKLTKAPITVVLQVSKTGARYSAQNMIYTHCDESTGGLNCSVNVFEQNGSTYPDSENPDIMQVSVALYTD